MPHGGGKMYTFHSKNSKKTAESAGLKRDLKRSAKNNSPAGIPVFLTNRFPHVHINAKLTATAADSMADTGTFTPVSRPDEASERSARQTAHRIVSMPTGHRPQKHQQPAQSHQAPSSLGSGRPLPKNTRKFFEPRFETDLSRIRIHTDFEANRMAQAINARAFCRNNHIVFGNNQYNPESLEGRNLLAHELAHATHEKDFRIYCERWNINDRRRKVVRQLLVQLQFVNTLWDRWSGTGWTTTRKNRFRSDFQNSIETAFNNGGFILRPPADANDVLPQQNIDQGYKPLVDIRLVPDGEISVAEDWEVDVSSNPTSEFRTSSSNTRYGTLDEADNTAVTKVGSAPGVTQVPTVHEFGHFIGLDHPGEDLEGSVFSPSRLSPGANEYTHTGTDAHGRTVDGPSDLMGTGMGMRPFYYDAWAQKLSEHISTLRAARQMEQFRERLRNLFSPEPEPGDFPETTGDTRYG